MKKFEKINPGYISLFALIVFIILWLFPRLFGFLSEEYPIKDYRSDLMAIAQIFYIVVTLWLVLVTRRMAETSINAQKALFRPVIKCSLLISDQKPVAGDYPGSRNLSIQCTEDSEFQEGVPGANIFLIINNQAGGGKAIDISVSTKYELKIPDSIIIQRPLSISFLSDGDCVALYLYRIEKPAANFSLKLIDTTIQFSTPFLEASLDKPRSISFSKSKPITAIGNHIGAIQILDGIRRN